MLIAARVLKCHGGDSAGEVAVRIFAPVERGGSWFCRYEIVGPDRTRTMEAGGADSAQALLIALQLVGAELYTSDAHRAGGLSLEGWNGGYGFPVPTSMRDELVGVDRSAV